MVRFMCINFQLQMKQNQANDARIIHPYVTNYMNMHCRVNHGLCLFNSFSPRYLTNILMPHAYLLAKMSK